MPALYTYQGKYTPQILIYQDNERGKSERRRFSYNILIDHFLWLFAQTCAVESTSLRGSGHVPAWPSAEGEPLRNQRARLAALILLRAGESS